MALRSVVAFVCAVSVLASACAGSDRDSGDDAAQQRLEEEREHEQRADGRVNRRLEREYERDFIDSQIADWHAAWRYQDEASHEDPQSMCDPTRSALEDPCPEIVYVSEVVDGDTLRLTDGELVRLAGVDAPEVYRSAECGGVDAKDAVESLLVGPVGRSGNFLGPLPESVFVQPVLGHPGRDAYGRLLRQVQLIGWLPTERGYHEFDLIDDLGRWLLDNGYARFDDYAYDHYVSNRNDRELLDLAIYHYRSAERRARSRGLGAWGGCW